MNIQMQIILNVFYYSKFIRIKYFFIMINIVFWNMPRGLTIF